MKKCADDPRGQGDQAVKKSISMPGTLFTAAQDRQRVRKYGTFSDYVQHLIRQDALEMEVAGGSR